MLDHGFLNIPLAKRGDIDSQIDRFKASEAAKVRTAAKAKREKLVADRKHAKNLVALISDERAADLNRIIKASPAQIRAKLRSLAHWEPALIISLLERENVERIDAAGAQ